ncbi:MAG: hypothetical protein ACI84K_001287, partial [Pseudohongiellaceae bacterium]
CRINLVSLIIWYGIGTDKFAAKIEYYGYLAYAS